MCHSPKDWSQLDTLRFWSTSPCKLTRQCGDCGYAIVLRQFHRFLQEADKSTRLGELDEMVVRERAKAKVGKRACC